MGSSLEAWWEGDKLDGPLIAPPTVKVCGENEGKEGLAATEPCSRQTQPA